jgi:hypothetical protein
MVRDIDPNAMTADDVAYIGQRHQVQKELKFRGVNFDSLREAADDLSNGDTLDINDFVDDEDAPEPAEDPFDEGAEGEGEEEDSEDYSEYDFQTLKDEIDARNEQREDDARISKAGSADDLRARLVEDDEKSADEDDSE